MKKVKIMLTAITVFAVVGGALAFKSAKNFHVFYSINAAGNSCDVPTTIKSTSTVAVGPIFDYTTFITTPDPVTGVCGPLTLKADL